MVIYFMTIVKTKIESGHMMTFITTISHMAEILGPVMNRPPYLSIWVCTFVALLQASFKDDNKTGISNLILSPSFEA